jgi:radical SAM protein with 4Fe4S-binding SPASM domain
MYHTLYLEATRRCNFSCADCLSGSQNTNAGHDDLSTATIIERILVPAKSLGTKYINFSGGEFLLRNDAFELLDKAHKLGLRITISSNGSTLNENILNELVNNYGENLQINLGINSFDESNIKTRQTQDEHIVELIKKINKVGLRINISVTIGEFNKNSFARTIEIIEKMGLPYSRSPFAPRNTCHKEKMLTKNSMKEFFHPVLCSHYKSYVSYVPFFLYPEDYSNISGKKPESPVPLNPSIGCWIGSFYAINNCGDVSPCPLLLDHVSGGNIVNDNLNDILFSSELFTKIIKRSEFKGKCGTCNFSYTCGGCRAYTYFLTGDVFGSDPTCFIEDLSQEEVKVVAEKTKNNFKNYFRMINFRNKLFN